MRILLEGAALIVHGPGSRFSLSQYRASLDATLQHAALEQWLVRRGWTLERYTSDRRKGRERRQTARKGQRRRSLLKLVDKPLSTEL